MICLNDYIALNFLKAVFLQCYLINSWIIWPTTEAYLGLRKSSSLMELDKFCEFRHLLHLQAENWTTSLNC